MERMRWCRPAMLQGMIVFTALSLAASPEEKSASARATQTPVQDSTRNPGNAIFDRTGVFVNSASAFPADRYASKLKRARVAWIALQIDNGNSVRTDNAGAVEQGWADRWRAEGFKVGFW